MATAPDSREWSGLIRGVVGSPRQHCGLGQGRALPLPPDSRRARPGWFLDPRFDLRHRRLCRGAKISRRDRQTSHDGRTNGRIRRLYGRRRFRLDVGADGGEHRRLDGSRPRSELAEAARAKPETGSGAQTNLALAEERPARNDRGRRLALDRGPDDPATRTNGDREEQGSGCSRRRCDGRERRHEGSSDPALGSAAESAAMKARRIQPWAASPALQLAFVMEQEGNLVQASAWIREAIKHDKTNWSLWLVSTRIDVKRGDVGKAEQSLRRAIELNPRSPRMIQLEQILNEKAAAAP